MMAFRSLNLLLAVAVQEFIATVGSAKPGDVQWTFPAGPGTSGPKMGTCSTYYGIDNAAPAVTSGSAYFMSEHTGWSVYAVDTKTGAERWHFTPNCSSATAVAVANDAVYFATEESDGAYINKLDVASGAMIWKVSVNVGGLFGPPVLAAGLLYIILHDGLHVFDASSGAASWNSSKPGCSETSPVVADGVVYVAGDGGVHAFDAKSGILKWISLPNRSAAMNPWAAPVVGDELIYTSSYGDASTLSVVYALDKTSGLVKWNTSLDIFDPWDFPGISDHAPLTPALADGRLFFGGAFWTLVALDARSGSVLWNAKNICPGHLWMVPAVANGSVYAGCDVGMLYVLNATTGVQQWSYGSDNLAVRSPVVDGGQVLFGVNGNHDSGDTDKLVALTIGEASSTTVVV